MSDKRMEELSRRAKELRSAWDAPCGTELGAKKLACLNGWFNSIQHTLAFGPGSKSNTVRHRHLQAKAIIDLLTDVQSLTNHDVTRETIEFVLEYETYDPR